LAPLFLLLARAWEILHTLEMKTTRPPSNAPTSATLSTDAIDYMMTHMSLADVLATVVSHLAPISQEGEAACPINIPTGRYSSGW
jgi:hypothetical protein